MPPFQRRFQRLGQQLEPCLEALGLGVRVILPVRHKIIVLALVEPGDILPGSAQPVVRRDSDDDGTAHPEQTLRRQRHRRVGKALGQPGQRGPGAGRDHEGVGQMPWAERLHRLQGIQNRTARQPFQLMTPAGGPAKAGGRNTGFRSIYAVSEGFAGRR